MVDQFLAELAHLVTERINPRDDIKNGPAISGKNRLGSLHEQTPVDDPQQRYNLFIPDLFPAKSQHLVEHRQGVAHAAVPLAGDHGQAGIGYRHLFLSNDIAQVRRYHRQ